MTGQVTVGPPVLTINRGSTFMVTDHSGEIRPEESLGVFAEDTRFVSTYRLFINGQPWQRVSSAAATHVSSGFYLTNPTISDDPLAPGIAAGVLSLTLMRRVDEGIHEDFQITNYSQQRARFLLEVQLESDFADLFEVKDGCIRDRERLGTRWDQLHRELMTEYEHDGFVRRFAYRIARADPKPTYANGRIRFLVGLEPGASWSACGEMYLQHDGEVRRPLAACPRGLLGKVIVGRDQLEEQWRESCTVLGTQCETLRHVYEKSIDDMGSLRLFERDLGPDVWVPAAGVPWFVTLFGRDSLVVSLQNVATNPRLAEGALRTLAQHQAAERDDWHDAQPGKIVHEVRHGELAHFNVVPHTRYYGTWDATPLFLVTLHQAWLWLGDRSLIEALCPTAERCLTWIDADGDLDGDGFQEYRTYSTKGYENMSWKDAGDAVVNADGTQVSQPKALCEMQGYVYAAKCGMAEIFSALGRSGDAQRLRSEAADLKRRFNEAFWMEDEGTYAFGLGPDKRQIRSVASNPGHCLWTGIVDDDKAERTVQRLLQPDMWSGWGIRTLSSKNPAYDPFSYQRGSIWPHDNAIAVAGMHRYGFHAEGHKVARAILDAAERFQDFRLPEVFAGLTREEHSFPVQYRGANIPQAWAAGSVFQFVLSMLGLQADAPAGALWVKPSLPAWAPDLTLSGLKVGQAHVSLGFHGDEAARETAVHVEGQEGPQVEIRVGTRPAA